MDALRRELNGENGEDQANQEESLEDIDDRLEHAHHRRCCYNIAETYGKKTTDVCQVSS